MSHSLETETEGHAGVVDITVVVVVVVVVTDEVTKTLIIKLVCQVPFFFLPFTPPPPLITS